MMRLLAFVFFASISSVVTALVRGTYRITNVKTRTTLRNFDIGQPIFIGNNTLEVPRQFDQWVITPIPKSPPNFFSLQNLGSHGFVGLISIKPEDPVITTRYAQVFNITKINDSSYVIQTSGADKSWDIELPVPKSGGLIKLRNPSVEKLTQQWVFEGPF